MRPSATLQPMTAQEFAAEKHKGHELIDGRVVERTGNPSTGNTTANVFGVAGRFTDDRDIGSWLSAVGLCCFPDDPNRVRRPNASFVRRERMSADIWKLEFLPIPPDLVMEVIPRNVPAAEVSRKVREYLEAGVLVVWAIYPETRTAFIHRPDGSVEIPESGELEAEPALPGFRCSLADVLPEWCRTAADQPGTL